MNRNIIIIGNGGAARECCAYVQTLIKIDPNVKFKGFLAFEGHLGNLKDFSSLLLGNDDDYLPLPGDEFVIGVGEPALRERIYRKWKARGITFINLIDCSCVFAQREDIGEANILGIGTLISQHVSIGDNNYFNGRTILSHDVTIGDSNFFGPGVTVLGNVEIGSGNSFGVNSVIMPNARIGNNNTIAPGAYVFKGCKNNSLLAGNPALKIK